MIVTLSDNDFKRIAAIAYEQWGLSLNDRKRELVTNRLQRFLRGSEFSNVEEYLRFLTTEADDEERLRFFDMLSTNVTSFFREIEHFNYLEREFYTPLARGNLTRAGRRLRLWSAACSTGPEPYSMAIQARELLPDLDSWDFRILATDLSNSAIEQAKRGVYPLQMVSSLEKDVLRRHFKRGTGENADFVQVVPAVRSLVKVSRLNLMEQWPVKGPFDVIFLRNVMIYFDRPTRQRLVQRMSQLLNPGGIFVIGSSETLSGLDVDLKTVQPAVYVKPLGGAS